LNIKHSTLIKRYEMLILYTMALKQNGFYGETFWQVRGVTEGDDISPMIINTTADAISI
jgi:hypothetical protein